MMMTMWHFNVASRRSRVMFTNVFGYSVCYVESDHVSMCNHGCYGSSIVRWDNISPPPPLHQISWKQPSLSNNKTTTPRMHIHHRFCRPIPLLILVPPETLAGTAAILIIALRGIPLHERARGLTAVLRATLLPSPLGISVSSGANYLDLPIGTDGKRR